MKKLFFLFFVIILLMTNNSLAKGKKSAVSFQQIYIDTFKVDVVKVNLRKKGVSIIPILAQGFPGHIESFQHMVHRTEPVVAINGTFYCKKTFVPVGDIMIRKKLLNFGGLGTAMCITARNHIDFIQVPIYTYVNWADSYTHVLAAGPRLLINGQITLNPEVEGFKDNRIFLPRNRSAVGLTSKDELLLVTVKKGIYLSKLAIIMKKLGAIQAMNLDGGGSSALYYRGRMITYPRNAMTNILVAYE